ncbi:hypothetical protein JOD45_002996 [Scopulibacillus daqui]|uniref:Uncharacterized protein n=1 Tax=Scopulibacillus daqui TaxID=1469162 RepID=A0ABS2Q5J1_9BACL|nr:hypothetical protein [Scopulibacillus daqui]
MKFFFKKMSEDEVVNSNKGLIFGFYIYLFLLAINSIYSMYYSKDLMSSFTILIIGLIVALVFEAILNIKNKVKKSNYKKK